MSDIAHGQTCPKAPHDKGGELHGPEDDTPYWDDGLQYCGRCHFFLSPPAIDGQHTLESRKIELQKEIETLAEKARALDLPWIEGCLWWVATAMITGTEEHLARAIQFGYGDVIAEAAQRMYGGVKKVKEESHNG